MQPPSCARHSTGTGGARFAVLWFGQFSTVAGLTVVVPLLPFYLASLGVPEQDVAWWTGVSLAAPAITQMIVAPLWGKVADSRHLLLAGLAGQAGVYALLVVFAPRVGQISGSIATATVWVGALQAVTWAGTLIGAPWWGYRNERHRPHIGFALAAAGCGLAVALQAVPTAPEALLPLRIVQGFCFRHARSDGAPSRQPAGTRTGTRHLHGVHPRSAGLGQVVGPLLGVLAAVLLPLPAAFTAIGLLFGLAAALAMRSARATRSNASSAAVVERADHDRTAASPLAQKQVT